MECRIFVDLRIVMWVSYCLWSLHSYEVTNQQTGYTQIMFSADLCGDSETSLRVEKLSLSSNNAQQNIRCFIETAVRFCV